MKQRLLITLIVIATLIISSCNSITDSSFIDTSEKNIQNLSTSIETDKDRYLIGEPVALLFTVTNLSDESPMTFLPWGTPMEEMFTNDCLSVTINEKSIEYKGIMVNRMEPQVDDYITIGPGESVVNRVELFDAYPLPDEGIYRIFFKGSYANLPKSNEITLMVE